MFLAERTFPASICVRVTRRCNAACAFCQAPNTSRATLTTGEISRIAAALRRHDVRTVKLSGGEPTTRADLSEIIGIFGRRSIKPIVITNGITINESVFHRLASAGGELKFSVHRPGIENDRVLRVRSFAGVRANMQRARSGSLPFSINTVVTPATITLMPDMVEFGIRQGARKISFIPVVARGRARAQRTFAFGAADLERARAKIAHLADVFRARIDIRCIDIRTHDYWVIENNGSLWIEKASDDDDVLICDKNELMEDRAIREGATVM